MKRILFVSHSPELNGAERWLLETLRGLNRELYEPCLVVPGPGRLEDAARAAGFAAVRVPLVWWITEKSRVWRQPAAWALTRKSAGRLAGLIDERGIDLVFSNSAAVSAGALAARRRKAPHIWAVHEMLAGSDAHLFHLRGTTHLTRLVLAHSRRIIVNSRFCASAFPDSGKIVIVPNGMTLKTSDPGRKEALRKEFGLGPDDPVLGVVGKLYQGKGQRRVLEAASSLIAAFPRLKIVVVGEAGDKAYAASLRRSAGEEPLRGRVAFAGWREDLADLLAVMNVLAVPSTVESFGRAALDGMSAGTPVVAARAGGLVECVEEGLNGLLVPPGNPAALAGAISRILADPALAARLTQGGRRTVETKFSLDRQIRGVESVLADVLSEAGR